ncbi:hypothetical protein WJX75_005311 [Coccomyxa subellipsoidea]|uniref:Uncharacterized protein n=1 Tax=Coccomyxa subellipsoidea TaxID=248742 RepID=A0ABR2YPY1_9CHLO
MEEDDEFVDYKEWLDAREVFVVTSKVFFPNLTSLRLDAQNVGMLNDHMVHSGRFPGLKPVMRRFEVINSCGNKARMAKIAKLAFPQDAVDDEGFRCICQTCNACIGISGL